MSLLRNQKRTLYELLEQAEIDRNENVISDLEGIIDFIDTIQDYAVDVMGMKEEDVFLLHKKY
jgi:hypothetical protein